MSIQARQWARGRVLNRLPTAAVLFMVCDYADRCGVAWVSQTTLARACGCGERTVREYLAALEDAGLIRRVRAHDSLGHRIQDFTVIAPGASDRAPLLDATKGAYPAAVGDAVVELARANPYGPTIAGRDNESLPAGSRHPYRQDYVGLPAGSRHPYRQGVAGRDSAQTPVDTGDSGPSAETRFRPNVVNALKATPPPPAVARDEARPVPERAVDPEQQQQPVVVEEIENLGGNGEEGGGGAAPGATIVAPPSSSDGRLGRPHKLNPFLAIQSLRPPEGER